QNLDKDYVLSLSFFAQRPEMYFGIYSREKQCIVRDAAIKDKVLEIAIKRLEKKYAFNTTREKPVEINELILAWVNYVNSDFDDEKIPLD
ncbi:MAG: hypothetical protein J5965_20025, partial [Aeriscardovia sp.]|nr:hypothetical protein [Aeriscardovia sp.]